MHSRPVGVLLACLLLVTAGSAVGAPGETTIEAVEFGGMGFVAVEGNTTFVWQSENATVEVTVTTGQISDPNHEVCVRAPSLETGERKLGCTHKRLESNTTTTVSVPVSGWPESVAGSSLPLEATLRKALSDTVVSETNASVTVISKDGHFDGDQLTNQREVELGTRISAQDTDGDGLWDGQEVHSAGSSPLAKDTDGDGVRDAVEVNYGTNASLDDTDGDGLSDDAEINKYATDPLDADSDGDSLSDGREVHELNSSPSAAATDADSLDDATELELGTDPADPDTDDDGLTDGVEHTQYDTNPLDADTDGDGVSDSREVRQLGTNPRLAGADSDGDLLSDELELDIGTDPGSLFSPWGYVVVVVAAGAVVVTQLYRAGWRVGRRYREVGGRRVRLPTVTVADESSNSTALSSSRPGGRTDAGGARSTGTNTGGQFGGEASEATSSGGSGPTDGQASASLDRSQRGQSTGNTDSDLPNEAFLTDTDRVQRFVEAAGGNCRQQDIVQETGWSKSKVSRLLSQMEDDDEIRKISLGRENVIVLPGEEPDAVRSALDDE
ncbi:helix-turn-helix transcriptional regulator [Halobacterium zhouii]|uniref:helix-turn-helix transcriptional regulator n=1 Tax=Halobacterium zhouii TaxID=2902624 RepID=UPI001E3A7432|nr:hypothetical protein [Halobacterium zhouii]